MSVTYTAPTASFEELSLPRRSPQEGFTQDGGFTATRFLRCAWGDRLTLLDQLRKAYKVTGTAGNFFVGDGYPHRDGVYVQDIPRIEGVGSTSLSGGELAWDEAELQVVYRERSFNPAGSSSDSSDPSQFNVAEETLDFTGQFLTLPNQTLYWDSVQTEKAADVEAPSLTVPLTEWQLAFTAELPLPQALEDEVGKVNANLIVSTTLGITFAAETLLYEGARISRQVGDNAVDLTMRFARKKTGWNKFYQSGTAAPQTLYDSNGNAFKPYGTSAFENTLDIGL